MDNSHIRGNWEIVKDRARQAAISAKRNPGDVTIVAVSKTQPLEAVIAGIDAGINDFGENYVQELKEKYDTMPSGMGSPPRWHYIGHLQTNKVKYIAPFISMIHSVDSIRLGEEISRQALKFGRTIDILLQVNVSGEVSKSGCEPHETVALAKELLLLPAVNLKGLMTIGTFSDDERIYRTEFRLMKSLLEELNVSTGSILEHLSMGMTHDFEAAIEEGATIIRVGTAIFGERFYA